MIASINRFVAEFLAVAIQAVIAAVGKIAGRACVVGFVAVFLAVAIQSVIRAIGNIPLRARIGGFLAIFLAVAIKPVIRARRGAMHGASAATASIIAVAIQAVLADHTVVIGPAVQRDADIADLTDVGGLVCPST
jgi:hypothetical protein